MLFIKGLCFYNLKDVHFSTTFFQDYQSKAAIRELGGFPPILDLLKSDYAVIQQLALTALHLASEDGMYLVRFILVFRNFSYFESQANIFNVSYML